jgi:hypothetical protein
MGEKNNCFVIQRFDSGGPIDGRFDEVLAPAMLAADIDVTTPNATSGPRCRSSASRAASAASG